MRILFDNKLNSATLSALHANSLYPVTRLKDTFLKRIYKSTQPSDEITITFASEIKVDSIYIGFTNALTASVVLKSSTDTTIYSGTLNIHRGGGIITPTTGVKSAVITFSGTENIYLGTIGIGDSYTMPDPLNDIIKGFVDNSKSYQSDDGQYAVNKIAWLRSVKASFATTDDIDLYNEIYLLFASVDRPIWLDCFENVDGALNPMYCSVEFKVDSKNDNIYKFSFEATEAR